MITTSKLPNEPILVVSIACTIEHFLAHMHIVHRQIAALIEEGHKPLHVVYDLGPVQDLGYSDILLWVAEYETIHTPGNLLDSRVRPAIAGTDALLTIWTKKIRQQMAKDVPHYATIQEAIAAIRAELQPPSSDPPAQTDRQVFTGLG